ncbi:hypothetical protein AX14_003179 [Amanita brunnescens Koide BX004]|nr:hypothetical protein AX14_003179 [Amanita brunnescens Koide BX004]
MSSLRGAGEHHSAATRAVSAVGQNRWPDPRLTSPAMTSSIELPSSPWLVPPIPLRPLLPICPPTLAQPLPALPSPHRAPQIHPSFALSTHIVPAAYIRSSPHVPRPPPSIMPAPSLGTGKKPIKEEKLRKATEVRNWLLEAREKDADDGAGYKSVLWNCVNRYYRIDSGRGRATGRGLTLFFAHANGFPKEVWEPTIKHLLASSADIIDEVWTWEAVLTGDAALINGEALSSVYDWIDNTRDTINFLTYFIPAYTLPGKALPTHLPRIPSAESDKRAIYGIRTRTIVGIGHSFGGCTNALAAIHNPNLFSSLILIDPVITKPRWPDDPPPPRSYTGQLSLSALSRRDGWSSRSEALALFQRNPFFASWDPSVLRVYVECGLYRSLSQPAIRLKMPPIYESVIFDSERTSAEVFAHMSRLDRRIKLRWIVPGIDNPEEMGPPGSIQQRVWLRPVNSTNVKIPNAGHLIPHEKPKELADDITNFLRETYPTASFRNVLRGPYSRELRAKL